MNEGLVLSCQCFDVAADRETIVNFPNLSVLGALTLYACEYLNAGVSPSIKSEKVVEISYQTTQKCFSNYDESEGRTCSSQMKHVQYELYEKRELISFPSIISEKAVGISYQRL